MEPTTKILIQLAVKAATDEEMRKRLLIFLLSIVMVWLFLIILAFYILTSPFQAIASFFTGDDYKKIEEIRETHAFNQTFDISDNNYIESRGVDYSDISFSDASTEVTYFNQADARWSEIPYGLTGTIGTSGCGPTSLAIVVSSLGDKEVNPVEMSKWAFENGYRCEGSGSYHSLIPEGVSKFGLKVEGVSPNNPKKIVEALGEGKLVIAIMSKGHFTSGGHFIVLRGSTDEGKILVADPISLKRSNQEWNLQIIMNEANKNASSGGPFWIIEKEKK